MIDKKIQDFLVSLTRTIQQEVKPHLGTAYAKQAFGTAVGGDTTFAIDEKAEEILHEELQAFGDISYYSEDKGLISFGQPGYILIVDPIDGTRPAAVGLETATVAIAVSEVVEKPTFGNVIYGIMRELKGGSYYAANRGENLIFDGKNIKPAPRREDARIENLFWTIGFRGRPALIISSVLRDLIDKSSVGGGLFDIGSATYSIWMTIEGRIDAYIDVGKRIIEEMPELMTEFKKVGAGEVLNNSPYDVAAAKVIAETAGCLVFDGYGDSLDQKPLLGSDFVHQVSCLVADTRIMPQIIEEINRGVTALKDNLDAYKTYAKALSH